MDEVEIDIVKLDGEDIIGDLRGFTRLFENVVRADNPAAYVDSLDRSFVRYYWECIAYSVLNDKTVAFVACIKERLFGVVECLVDEREIALCGCRVKKLLVDPRSMTEEVKEALLDEVDFEAWKSDPRYDKSNCIKKTGIASVPGPPVSQGASPSPVVVKPAGIWLQRRHPGFELRDQITIVPAKNPDLSTEFYQNGLGLRPMSFECIGVFFHIKGGTLCLRPVDSVHPRPWPILEWSVPDLLDTVLDLMSRNVKIVQNGIHKEDAFGIFVHPDGGKRALIRDPDGNLFEIKESVKSIRRRRRSPRRPGRR